MNANLNKKVKAYWGRNKGLYGKIISVDSELGLYFVDFGGSVFTESTFYPDCYWIKSEFVEVIG